jgi:ABC-type Fe3+ transport system permease subunit
VYTVLPFVAMLLAIAVCPLWIPHWWESNRNKFIVALLLGAPILALYLWRRPGALVAMGEEYVSFIILLAGLYVISGGILLRGDLEATPLTNTLVYTSIATALCALVGTLIAYVVVRRRSRITALLDQGVMLAYAVPGIVLAIGLIITFHEPPVMLTGTAAILVLAYFIRRLPFSVRSAASMLQQLSRDVEEASVNLGAAPARTFARITVPLLK